MMKFFKKTDIAIICGILVLAAVLYFVYFQSAQGKQVEAKIFYENKLVKVVSLSEGKDYDFSVKGHENVVFHVYADGSIAFVESDCPDKVCIHAGKLKMAGQSAACLPNGLVLRIAPLEDNLKDPDVVI
jgi:hypothetical protein